LQYLFRRLQFFALIENLTAPVAIYLLRQASTSFFRAVNDKVRGFLLYKENGEAGLNLAWR
jgi:hypothetical protein